MLLTISTTHRPAGDLGYLLHKRPDRFQSFDLSFGQARVFYPEAGEDRCTAALMLDVDAVGLVRGRKPEQDFLLAQYVNDRPYVASSFLSVAIAQVFGSALQGRCKERPELVATPIPLAARLEVLAVRGGEPVLQAMLDPSATKSKRFAMRSTNASRNGRRPVLLRGQRHRGALRLRGSLRGRRAGARGVWHADAEGSVDPWLTEFTIRRR